MGYRDILKRNEKMIDNMYELQDDVQDLANENELLNNENENLYHDNIVLDDENQGMKDDIEELHRNSRRYGRRYSRNTINNTINYDSTKKVETCGYVVKQEETKPICPLQPKEDKPVDRRAISLYFSDRTKNILIFVSLIGLILLLGLGIDPSTPINYNTILDLYIDLRFNLYKIVILGCIGVLLRLLWKKIDKK